MRAFLDITGGPRSGESLEIPPEGSLVVGRHPDADLAVVDDLKLSRYHSVFELNTPAVCVRDMNSLNGFRVNGVRYGGRVRKNEKIRHDCHLQNGDIIEIGATSMRLRIGLDETVPAGPEDTTRPSMGKPPIESDAPAGPDEPPPPEISGYAVESVISRGGMGTIYLATEEKSGEKTAIKVLRYSETLTAELVKKFQREIDMTRELQHKNIVGYRGHGRVRKAFYLVLEYVPGLSLDMLMRQKNGRIAFAEARSILLGVLDGMAYAHGKGYIHRDIKPGNILLSGEPGNWTPRVADFGLGKLSHASDTSALTMTGMVSGTCVFMPREQITNYKYLTPVSDVFSLGATFYNMLTGFVVYDLTKAANPFEAVLASAVVPLAERNSGLPAPVVAVIDRAIRRDPEQRYQNAGEMRDAMREAVVGSA